MKRRFASWISWSVGVLVVLGAVDSSFAQAEDASQTQEKAALWQDLSDFYTTLSNGCVSTEVEQRLQCAQEGLSARSQSVQARINARTWKSPELLQWVLEWMNSQNRRVLAHELPALHVLVGESQTKNFLQSQLPGDTVPPTDSNLETLTLQIMVVWKQRPLRQSHGFEHLLEAKYRDSVDGNRRYMLHWAAWMGHAPVLNKIHQVATTYWNLGSVERWMSFTKRQEFQNAVDALLEFTSSDPSLQSRAQQLRQAIGQNSHTPDAVLERIKKSYRSTPTSCC